MKHTLSSEGEELGEFSSLMETSTAEGRDVRDLRWLSGLGLRLVSLRSPTIVDIANNDAIPLLIANYANAS